MAIRKIIHIDEEKCNGCGLCVPSCAEGALQIINGKAKLVSDRHCDGLGDCLGECPQGALTIIEREAEPFDESLVPTPPSLGGCPGAQMRFRPTAPKPTPARQTAVPSELRQWPVQLALVPPNAPYFHNAHLVVAADCVPFAYANFHQEFLRDCALVIACPKLDEVEPYVHKLAAIIKQNNLKKISVVHMEVPCCFGLKRLIQAAMELAGTEVEIADVTISIEGEVLSN